MFVTWRLAGTFPCLLRHGDPGHAFVRTDRILDLATEGPRWLKHPEVAQCVVNHLLEGDGITYEMHAYVVMPNHVHVLLTPGIDLSAITRTMKGRSARQANLLLGRTGQVFWQDESFDHWIRHPDQFEKVRRYIERNPVKAGLVREPELRPYSSAKTTG